MSKKMVDFFKKISRDKPVFDPSVFGDPLAHKTEWIPLKGGGANFKTHRLQQVDYHRLQFQSSLGAKIFYSIFLIVGLGIIAVFAWPFFREEGIVLEFELFLPLIFGSIFAIVGGALLYFGNTPIVFDKTVGYFWKGRKTPTEMYSSATSKKHVPLQDIHALQLIREYVSSNKSSYYSYEMNLVLKDGQRINVVDHGSLEQIRQDAQTIALFLGRPVWDAAQ